MHIAGRLEQLLRRVVTRALITRMLLIVTLGCAVLVASGVSASPASAVSRRTQLRREAVGIMKETYSSFMLTKRYDRYPPFDWSSDGSSARPR